MPAKNHVSRYKIQKSDARVEINDDSGMLKLGDEVYGWRPNRDDAAPEVARRCYVHFKNRRLGLCVTFARGVRNILIHKIVNGQFDDQALLANHIEDVQVVFPIRKRDVIVNKKM